MLLTKVDVRTLHSFGPIEGEQPAGTTWATNFPHTAWFDMSQYYITAFKTGSYPPITVRTPSSGIRRDLKPFLFK